MLLLLHLTALLPIALAAAASSSADADYILDFHQLILTPDQHSPHVRPSIGHAHYGGGPATESTLSDPMEDLRAGLHVMQTWFEVWVGNWPSGIDWTRAVINTHLASTLSTLSKALHRAKRGAERVSHYPWLDQRDVENEINLFFAQNVAYYFGENAFRLRNEAYDDILWVVLGWLESVKFIQAHSQLHFESAEGRVSTSDASLWHGSQFITAYAHRARIFYDLAAHGWDDFLCDGGMVWSPYLGPYKNAITNELYIAASASMYLYFPGDNNTSPFTNGNASAPHSTNVHDPAYLQNAIKGYAWLKNSSMTNRKGLYVDGFHISHWKSNGTKCDIRNNMVYTYNQGVLLSGLRALWEGAGNRTYLEDGHELVRNVIKATGWDSGLERATNTAKWAGLGRNGIIEDHCDARGRCDQDAQTFKSIFFHHLTLFCEPLPLRPRVPGKTHAAVKALAYLHRQSCRAYAPWVACNAEAALKTRDEKGRFGMWWGTDDDVDEVELPDGAVDYRNDPTDLFESRWAPRYGFTWSDSVHLSQHLAKEGTLLEEQTISTTEPSTENNAEQTATKRHDLNDRGRGRTVETQAGGVAVLRCLWELLALE